MRVCMRADAAICSAAVEPGHTSEHAGGPPVTRVASL